MEEFEWQKKRKSRRLSLQKIKMLLPAVSPQRKNSVENKEKQKQFGAHQPRDADTTSGHNVQKFKQPESANGSVKQNASKQKDRADSAGVRDNRSGFQGETWKNTGQKAKSSQKKRRQQGKFRKENSLTGQKEKPDSNNADSKTESGFSKEQNAFTEDSGGGQTEETKESGDDYRRRDTYHQSEKKGRYRRREHQDRERTKTSDFGRDFQTKEHDFTEKNTFAESAEPEFHGSKKLDRLQKKRRKPGKRPKPQGGSCQRKGSIP